MPPFTRNRLCNMLRPTMVHDVHVYVWRSGMLRSDGCWRDTFGSIGESHLSIFALPSHGLALPSHGLALPSHGLALPSHGLALPS
jgi:hypothetical protein